MKTIQLHPASLLAGALAAGVLFVAAGLAPAAPLEAQRVAGIPAPADVVRIEAGKAWTVPDGQVLVVTGIVLAEGVGANNEITFDKETVFKAPGGGTSSIPQPGLVAEPGTDVKVKVKGTYLVGYLADA